jgi:hypothetical protein
MAARMRLLQALLGTVAAIGGLLGCGRNAQGTDNSPFFTGFVSELNGVQVGGLYSVDLGEGFFRVAKVLALNDSAVHLLLYGNRFPARPSAAEVIGLEVRGRGDPQGWGIHHLPLAWDLFNSWQPNFIQASEVTPDELQGFEQWKQAQGGIWSLSGMGAIQKLLSDSTFPR